MTGDPDALHPRPGPDRRRVDGGRALLGSVIVLLLGAMLLAVLPVSGRASTWVFQAPLQHTTQDLVLVSEPQDLTFETSGRAVLRATNAAALPVALFDTGTPQNYGSLRLMGQGGMVFVEFVGAAVPALRLAVVPEGSVSLSYRPDAITLRSGFAEQTVRISEVSEILPASTAHQVHVAGPTVHEALLPDSTLTVATPPSTLVWPWWRWILVLALLAAFVRPNMLLHEARATLASPRGRSLTAADTAVGVVAFVSLFLNPPLPDDNWVLTTNRQLPEVGFFSNYYTANAAPQPQGFWWSIVEHLWLGQYGIPAFWLRIPSVLITVFAWWLLRRYVIDSLIPENSRRPAQALGAFVMVVMVLAWTPTLRPEPVVVLLSVLALIFALAQRQKHRYADLQLVGGLAALAISVHQSGIILVGMFVACLAYEWYLCRAEGGLRGRLVAVASSVAGLTAVLLMINSNLQIARWAASSFRTEGLHDAVLDEIRRFEGLAQPAILAVRLLAALLVYGCIVAYAASPRAQRLGDREFLSLVSVAGLLGLALTSSKWPWHFAAASALVVAVVVMALGNALARGPADSRYLIVLAGGLALAFAVVFAHRYETARLDTLAVSLTDLSGQVWFRVIFGPWSVLAAVAAILWWWGRQRRLREALVVTLVLLTGLITARAFLPAVLDEVEHSEGAWPSVMVGSAAGDACGILTAEDMFVPVALQPVPEISPSLTAVPSRVVSTEARGPAWKPPAPAPVREAMAPGATGSPWFVVRPGGSIRVYFLEGLGRLELSVLFAKADLSGVAVQPVSRTSSVSVWGMADLQVPQDATRVAIFWNTWDGPVAVQDPVEILHSEPVTNEVGQGPLWTNPDSGLWGSCVRMPRIDTGAFEAFSWSLDYPRAGLNAPLWTSLASISEQSCRDLVDGGRFCIYRVDRYYQQPQPAKRVLRNWGEPVS